MAAHESPRTTKLYDRTGDEITLDEVERITIWARAWNGGVLGFAPRPPECSRKVLIWNPRGMASRVLSRPRPATFRSLVDAVVGRSDRFDGGFSPLVSLWFCCSPILGINGINDLHIFRPSTPATCDAENGGSVPHVNQRKAGALCRFALCGYQFSPPWGELRAWPALRRQALPEFR